MEPNPQDQNTRPAEAPAAAQAGPDAEAEKTVAATVPDKITERPGDSIGRYKLLQQIGEGGCGVVYMAEQEEPVRRRVALKVIKVGMDTKSVIARFEAERQALALMDHPNIAKVLDAGATDAGRPFFVMELVRGIRITDYCDQNKLSTEERLKLFVQICQAIQHAHQKGIIHRDIKPSNILVTLHDGVPVPKVIDFGIAKATQGRLTDATLFTAFEQFIGTPAYMSPEQAEMSGLDVDTRSDIYALGVLLYELLTSRTPFDAKELLSFGLDKLRAAIREREPERPSTRLRTMLEADLTNTANHRHTDPPRLIHLLRGDLDWIVMKTLEKDRTRRYETANGLALDIQRHLKNEPVLARPPSNAYRFQKMVRRNKMLVAAAGAVVLALLLGFGVSLYLFVQERAARQRAVAAEQEQARLRKQAENALALEEKLRVQTALGEKFDAAGRLLGEGRAEEAEDLLLQIPPHPASGALLNSLGLIFARRGDWTRARTNFSRLVELLPSEQQPYYCLAALLVAQGDLPSYYRHSERIVAQFGDVRAPVMAAHMAKACLILPPAETNLPTLVKMAVAATLPGAKRQVPDESKLVRALAEYRQGHFGSALEWLQKIEVQGSETARAIQTQMVLAMAKHQVGRDSDAREALAAGTRLAGQSVPRTKNRDLGLGWSDTLIAHALTREAKALIEGETKAER